MQYRKFGKLNWKASVLGFGTMRFPVINNDQGQIDVVEATRMVHHAIDNGVNYIDTAYMYHNDQSESFVGQILTDGYRQKVKLATKLPSWMVETASDFDRFFDTQMDRLKTEYVDFYLLHSLQKSTWENLNRLGVIPWAEKQIAAGRIKYLGFSFHDTFEVFKEIVDGYDNWTLCQIQYNYMDTEYQAGIKGLTYAADKGLAVVIMEPLRGGQLTKTPPRTVAKLLASDPQKRTQAEWALQYVWNHPGVSVVLSGMSTMDQVRENIISADQARANCLKDAALDRVEQFKAEYIRLCPIPCTACNYCLPCAQGVNIPENFEYYNDAAMYDDLERQRWRWSENLPATERADLCIECGECEEKCPQEIHIIDWLKKADTLFNVQ